MKSPTQHQPRGIALLLTVIFVAIVLLVFIGLTTYLLSGVHVTTLWVTETRLRPVAEAGIDYAVAQLNDDPDFTGAGPIAMGAGSFTVDVTDIDASNKEVTSTGSIGNRSVTVRARLDTNTDDVAFNYGVQVGEGGLTMGENAFVVGNVYANGSIAGDNGSYVAGSATVAGGTALTADQVQSLQNSEQEVGHIDAATDAAQSFVPDVTAPINTIRLFIRKSGNPSNATVHIVADNGANPGRPMTTALTQGTLSASLVTGSFGWVTVTFASNPVLTAGTHYWIVLDVNNAFASKYYILGKHTNSGYGNGVGIAGEDWDDASPGWFDAGGDFTFETTMGGVDTFIDGVRVGNVGENCALPTHAGNARAHIIRDSEIICDAYYQTLQGSTVGGTSYPGSTDAPVEDFPISDGLIDEWENDAATGSLIDPSPATEYQPLDGERLGPARILGDLFIGNGDTVTLTGTVWVEGNILLENGASFVLDPAYGPLSGIVIADAIGNEDTVGKLTIQNNVTIQGSGTAGSYMILVSTNTGQTQGSDAAVMLQNNSDQTIIYAPYGLIDVSNNAGAREAMGYALALSNNASVTYESGLANAMFSSGPGGAWTVQPGTWQLIP
ncbi:MAG: hypothetical protein HY341_00380 [Candidatus Kerfeldbacteria bacterium]|nr:hypothetical protein [Candidatus Kerfeldbacteria bacterium]